MIRYFTRLALLIVIVGLLSCTRNLQPNISKSQTKDTTTQKSTLCSEPSFSKQLPLVADLQCYFDFEEGLSCSKELNKPYLVYFTGILSIECRELEYTMYSNKEIIKTLKEEFVMTTFYTDVSMELPKEHFSISHNGDTIKTYSEKSLHLQKSKFKENVLPAFYILNSKGELIGDPYHFDLSTDNFKAFLQKGLKEHQEK
jgi:thiol:disulfide interchange protein DsbD